MENSNIVVIGAGVIGQGVSYQFAKYGFAVILIDISEKALDLAEKEIQNIFKIDSIMSKKAIQNNTKLISYTTNLNEINKAYFIIENITENIEQKENLYIQINSILKENIYIAINTSCIPIGQISSLMKNPENILGIHFMNPVYFKPTVEIIKSKYTSIDTMNKAANLLKQVNMDGIVVNDSPGFISNRILMLTINESIRTLQEGVSSAINIDNIHKKCFGYKMGPIETADLIGLDTILNSLKVLYESFNEDKYLPASLLIEMVSKGKLGRKTEEGFYKY